MKHEKLFTRKDGSQARIVVTGMTEIPSFKIHRQVDVFTQAEDGVNWCLCADTPNRHWESLNMSVDEYLLHGRHPMFHVVSPAEILLAQKEFGEKFSN